MANLWKNDNCWNIPYKCYTLTLWIYMNIAKFVTKLIQIHLRNGFRTIHWNYCIGWTMIVILYTTLMDYAYLKIDIYVKMNQFNIACCA
ncbi:hypothetical protein DiNV_CH01M_ORF23 [Drosophila innubila nudivirus]|uniref:Uncharacterized protein n=1 Tax=Drosophila innubila nudivirus TaxID=2057187 RepID=A0A2H4UX62_9VIRU|nr:hypothetical protein DiNV_CH01M_ORF23 [Drosophila innubila nudivirus]ATZ81505.1 hypothetical protein DiNV_CH01M_ORF23 [Drosophila innubila nudivirus]